MTWFSGLFSLVLKNILILEFNIKNCSGYYVHIMYIKDDEIWFMLLSDLSL
jgi:hypothetical protein